MSMEEVNDQCAGATNEYYIEKQKQLSDWYYIKTKTIAENCNTAQKNPIINLLKSSNANTGFKGLSHEKTFNQPDSLPQPNTSTANKKLSRWNNTDEVLRNAKIQTSDAQAVYHGPSNSFAMETKKHTRVINSSLPRQYTHFSKTPNSLNPTYNSPPDCSTFHNCLMDHHDSWQHNNQQSIATPKENALSNVNVKMLKKQYQQQHERITQQSTILDVVQKEYTNATTTRRAVRFRSRDNQIGLQLKHWENIGNDNTNTNGQHQIPEDPTTLSLSLRQQQQLGLLNNHSHNKCCSNNCSDTKCNNTNRINNNSGSIKQQHLEHQKEQNNCSNVLHQQHASLYIIPTTHSQFLNHSNDIVTPQLHLSSPPAAISTAAVAKTMHEKHTTDTPRRPLQATPRPALRSKLLQNLPDEPNCTSFEQLNVLCSAKKYTTVAVEIENVNDDVFTDRIQSSFAAKEVAEKVQNQPTHLVVLDLVDNDDTNQASIPGNVATVSLSGQDALTKQNYVQSNSDSFLRVQLEPDLLTESKNNTRNTQLPETFNQEQQQIQMQLQQNPLTRQLFGVVQDDIFQPKPTLYVNNCNLSGSYASLECPSPPGPPVCLPESRRDPLARLNNYLRNLYQELSFQEPLLPPWAIPVAPVTLCAARLEPDLRINLNSHGFSESITVDQILVALQTKEGNFLDAPKRCLIECPAWASRSNLCLRILHAWAKEPPWPPKGTPIALTLFIPLNELKQSFLHYVKKELLPKGPLNPFANGSGGFNAAWNSLETLGPKLLIILDGYTSQKIGSNFTNGTTSFKKNKLGGQLGNGSIKQSYPLNVHEILDGKLFPEARVIITTSVSNCMELMPIVQRHIMYEGLTWGRTASILEGGQWGGPSRLLDIIQESVHLRKAVRTPLGCLAIAATYEATGGNMPIEELDVIESILNCVAPEASPEIVSELGRLALFCLKMKRTFITMSEIKMYCSLPNKIIGCLDKDSLYGKTAKKKAEFFYNAMCSGMMEFLAANYIASLASRPGLLAAEITGMAIGDELDPELLKVLKFAMALLGEQAHILLSRLTPLWLTPQIVFNLALAGGHNESNLAALCDIMGISKHPPISPLETRPLWVQVRSVPTDLMGWGMALKSPTCTLKNLEVIYQLEKQNISESRKAIEIFLDSIATNESVSTLRLSSLIEMDVKDSEISYLANCVSKLLLKPRLENFELVLTLIEEDPPILKLQSVVAALSRTISRQPKLCSLLLDLGLSTSQLVQLCGALEKCPNVTRLSLPHLRCERGAISAITSLLNSRPITFLSLPSCWGARDDPPSSSGVSMGSGSGSSTGTSCLIKQGSLPGVPSPRSYAPGIFSSLPRGMFVPQSSLGRSATLPRQPLEQSVEKRSCDSVVSKNWYPTPACDGGSHNSGTLHDLFLSIRESYSKLHGLDLSKAQLSLEDSMCLGETVRLSNTLHTLKLEGSSRISEILPSILGACESPCLQMLSIGSQRLTLDDSLVVMCARALTSCSTLRLLSVDGWCFRIEHAQTFSILKAFLSLTSIRELSLANCRLQTGLIKPNAKPSAIFESRSVVVLKLAGTQILLPDLTVLRGPQIINFIGGFTCLRELDLSAPARSGIESTNSSPHILDDKCIAQFFQNLHSNFGLLNTLKLCNWILHFDELTKTLKLIGKAMRYSPISHLKLDGISVLDRPKKQRSEAAFIHCFITTLPQLRWMGISLSGKKDDQIVAIGNAVLDLKGNEIEIKLSESTIEQAKLMAQAISLDGKFDIKVSTFGTSSGILIHAEKSGIKSLTRKIKDKDQYF